MKKITLLIICALFVTACAKKQTVKEIEPLAPKQVEEAMPAEPAEPSEETQIRYGDWQAAPQIATIYFEYDQSDLLPSAREALKRNAEYLKNNKGLDILVEGNCDERGTFEYNLALGQRRAAAVREYYGQLGVQIGRIGTISYGEEKPVALGPDEASLSKNRRADTKVRTKK